MKNKSGILKFLRMVLLTFEMTKSSILSAMEYRVSFIIQVVGMFVNDIALLMVWLIFFQKFPVVNGWRFQDSMLLLSLATVNYGIMMIFGRGAFDLSRMIARGELDYYLSFPKNVLWHVSVSKTDIPAIGDLLFGLVLFFFSGDITFAKTVFFFLISFITAMTFYNFTIIVQSIAFFVGNFEAAAEQLFHALLGFVMYPQTTFYGILKLVMYTVLPAFFIATLPVQLIRNFNLKMFLILIAFCLFTLILAITVFRTGLKRYESGSLINVKM